MLNAYCWRVRFSSDEPNKKMHEDKKIQIKDDKLVFSELPVTHNDPISAARDTSSCDNQNKLFHKGTNFFIKKTTNVCVR